jgi:hypothetical protein
VLAKIPAKRYAANSLVVCCQRLDHVPGMIATTIFDENYLEVANDTLNLRDDLRA